MQNTEFAAVSHERDDQVEHLYLDLGGPASQRLLIPSAQPASNESNFHTQTVSSVMAYWGKAGAAFGALWGFITDTGLFQVPGISPGLTDGPLASWITAVIQDALVFGLVSAFCAGVIRSAIRRAKATK
jgi:hypothetical protein